MASKLVRISGSRHQVGLALGNLARPIMSVYLEQSSTWHALRPWRGHPYLQELSAYVQLSTPSLWEELQGMAEGLHMPFEDVFLWNCRGDLLHRTNDGCTSIALYGADGTKWIAHNEDGDPYLFNRCYLVDVQPDNAPGYVSFYYPGSLPGHTFAANRAGLVQTINNVRAHARGTGVPRMVVARAVLDCTTLEQAVSLLRDTPRAGAFHHTLGSPASQDIISVEAIPGMCSATSVTHRYGHANHLIHAAMSDMSQIITGSSQSRQHRIEQLLDHWDVTQDDEQQIVQALHDAQDALPIFRTEADDPDEENTLATAVFCIHGPSVQLRIYDRNRKISQDLTLV